MTTLAEVCTISPGHVGVPLLAHIPHSATPIPPDLRPAILLGTAELERELLALTDWYTHELFAPAVRAAGGVAVVYQCSRLVVDPERFADDAQEEMSAVGMGVIYTRTSTGAPLRTPPTATERAALLRRCYWPYHRAIEREVDTLLAAFGRCLILDGHSFPSRPLPCELDQDPDRPDICLGTDAVHTPEPLARLVEGFCATRGLRTTRNRPYRGTYVPLKHYHTDRRVSSVMIEVNRRLYLDEGTGARAPSFHAVQRLVADLVGYVAGME
ncbi:MAG: N-formylglutamate amidohydrolase [Chloroflexi bacterium]|nr:N-formylglutamate amidohydrolase [Chloroflexota bacterium]